MSQRVDKLERLMNLTAVLLESERPISGEDLRARIPGYPDDPESARRQFERDKEDLREMGIPLRIETVPGSLPELDGYFVRKDEYYLRDPGLTAEELGALHLASSLVRIDGLQGLGGLWKLGGTVAEDRGPGAAVEPLPADPNLVALFGALADRRVVTFRYRDTARELHPYRLDHQNGRWYVSGFDQARAEDRVFRLDRIDGRVEAISEPGAFERPEAEVPGLQLDPWLVGDGEPVEARLAVDASQAPVVVHHLGTEAVERTLPDGSVVLRIAVTNPDGFRAFVLGFLEHAEVLDPPELRQSVIDWLETQAAAGAT
jgi:proteasome accessory factor B